MADAAEAAEADAAPDARTFAVSWHARAAVACAPASVAEAAAEAATAVADALGAGTFTVTAGELLGAGLGGSVGGALAARIASDEEAAAAAEQERRAATLEECEASATEARAAAEEARAAAEADGVDDPAAAAAAAAEAAAKAAVADAAVADARDALGAPFAGGATYIVLAPAVAAGTDDAETEAPPPPLQDAAAIAAALEDCPHLCGVISLYDETSAPVPADGASAEGAEGADVPTVVEPERAPLATFLAAAPVRSVALIDAPFDPAAEPEAVPAPAGEDGTPVPLGPAATSLRAALVRLIELSDAYDAWRSTAKVHEVPDFLDAPLPAHYTQLMDAVPAARCSVAVTLDCMVEQIARDAALGASHEDEARAVADEDRVGEVTSLLDAAFAAINLGDVGGAGPTPSRDAPPPAGPVLVYESDAIARGAATLAAGAGERGMVDVDVEAIEARMLELLAPPGGEARRGMPESPELSPEARGARRTALAALCAERGVALEPTERLALLRAATDALPVEALGGKDSDAAMAIAADISSRTVVETMPATTLAQVYFSSRLLREAVETYYAPDDAVLAVVYDSVRAGGHGSLEANADAAAADAAPNAVAAAPSFGEFVRSGVDATALPHVAYDVGAASLELGTDHGSVTFCSGGGIVVESATLGGPTLEAPGRRTTVGLRAGDDGEALVVATTAEGTAVTASVTGTVGVADALAAQASAAEARAAAKAAAAAAADVGESEGEQQDPPAEVPPAETAERDEAAAEADAKDVHADAATAAAAPVEEAAAEPEAVEAEAEAEEGAAEAAAVASAEAALRASLCASLPSGLIVRLAADGTVTQRGASGSEERVVLPSGAVIVRGGADAAATTLLLTDGSVAVSAEVRGTPGWECTNATGVRWATDAGAWVFGGVEYVDEAPAAAARDAALASATLAVEEAKAAVAEAEAGAEGEAAEAAPVEAAPEGGDEEGAALPPTPAQLLAEAEERLAAIGDVECAAPRMSALPAVAAAEVTDPDSGARVVTRADLALVVTYASGHTLAQHADGTASLVAPKAGGGAVGGWRVERAGYAPVCCAPGDGGVVVTVSLPGGVTLEARPGDGALAATLPGEGALALRQGAREVSYSPEAEETQAFAFDAVTRSVSHLGGEQDGGVRADAAAPGATPRVFVFAAGDGGGAELLRASEARAAVARAEAAAAAGAPGVTVVRQPLANGGSGVSLLSPVGAEPAVAVAPRLARRAPRAPRPASALRGLRALPVPSMPPLPEVLTPGTELPPLPRCVAAPPAEPSGATVDGAASDARPVAYRQFFIAAELDGEQLEATAVALGAFKEWGAAMEERSAEAYAVPEVRSDEELAAASEVLARAMAIRESEAAAAAAYAAEHAPATAPRVAPEAPAAAWDGRQQVEGRERAHAQEQQASRERAGAERARLSASLERARGAELPNYFLSEEGVAAARADPALLQAGLEAQAEGGAAPKGAASSVAPGGDPVAPPQASTPPQPSAPTPEPEPEAEAEAEPASAQPPLHLPPLKLPGDLAGGWDSDDGGPASGASGPSMPLSPRSSKFDIYGSPRAAPALKRRPSTLARSASNERFESVESPVRRTTRNSPSTLYRASAAGAAAPQFALSPAHLRFGPVRVGASRTLAARLANVSPELGRYAVRPTSAPFSAKYAAGSMAAGMSAKVEVSFAPTAEGPFEGEVTVASEYTILRMRVSGTGAGSGSAGGGGGDVGRAAPAPVVLDETKTLEEMRAERGG